MQLTNKIPIAVESHSKLDLPFDHVSTGMFMLLQPMYYRHTLRTENNHFVFTSNVRPNPIVVPSFGRVRQNLRHFFVPYRLIFPNWEEHIEDVIASNFDHSSLVVGVPKMNGDVFTDMFVNISGLTTVVANPTTTPRNFDFNYGAIHYKFTRLGRYFYKVIYSLGYDLLPKGQLQWNALALLAYARVYCDWFTNAQYLNDSLYLKLMRYFKFNDPSTSFQLTYQDVYDILLFIRPALYNSNPYFEDAWDNPVSPNSNQFTAFTFADPTDSGGAIVSTISNGTPVMIEQNNRVGTKYTHDALQKLSKYQRRHALSGAHAIDRVLADYGLQTENLRIQRSIYVGCSSIDVDINSIYATANGANSSGESIVGDFAGIGFGRNSNSIQFQNDEEGMFITISTLQPSGGYYQGYDRHNRHLSLEQFYIPAFDAIGVQSIEKGEVYVSKDLDNFASSSTDYIGHFGFTGRYGEYKRSISRVSGDIALPSVLNGGHAWHLMREFNDAYFNNSAANITHSLDFTRGTDAESYLRLFTYTDYDVDPFNLFLHVDVTSYSPCHNLVDSFDWDSDSERVSINSNGPKVN